MEHIEPAQPKTRRPATVPRQTCANAGTWPKDAPATPYIEALLLGFNTEYHAEVQRVLMAEGVNGNRRTPYIKMVL